MRYLFLSTLLLITGCATVRFHYVGPKPYCLLYLRTEQAACIFDTMQECHEHLTDQTICVRNIGEGYEGK